MRYLIGSFGRSVRRACRIVNLSKSVFCYKPRSKDEALIRQRMKEIAEKRTRFGCPRIHVLLKREGLVKNHKRTERIYREGKLSLRRKNKRKRTAGMRLELPKPLKPNHIWSMDFVSDTALTAGR